MPEIRLPSLGAEMKKATLLEWFVQPGDRIEVGTVVALLDTEKAEIEMEAFVAGTIGALLVEPGQTVDVGTPIASLEDSDARSADEAEWSRESAEDGGDHERESERLARPEEAEADEPESREKDVAAEKKEAELPTPRRASRGERIRATPLARRLARERGIDLAEARGSGPQGAVVAADLQSALEDVTAPSDDDGRAARRRQIIAAAMARSKREIPHYYLATSIDVQGAVDWLAARNEGRPVDEQLLLPALLVKSVAQAARRFPELNGHWRDDGFEPADTVDVGMVISLRTGGLVVPTLRDADQRSVPDLTRQLRDVVGRARAGRLRSGELGEATITVTSLGEHGAERIFGVIYPPQVAIVGFGAAHPEVRAEGDLHGTRLIIQSTLAADHRASDGRQGSRFLELVSQSLLDPDELCAESKTTAAEEADADAAVEADSDAAVQASTSQPISDDFTSIRRQVFDAIIEVAPDLTADDLGSSADLHDDLGLDSIDLANIMAVIAQRTSYEISRSSDAPVRSVEDLVRGVIRLAEERDASP